MSTDLLVNTDAPLGALAPMAAALNALTMSAELPQEVLVQPDFALAPAAPTAPEAPMAATEDEAVAEVEEWDHVPLVAAVRRGDIEATKTLYADMPNVNTQFDGMSLLYLAVFKQREDVIEFLMSRGASPNTRNDEDFDSPLILARRRGDTEIIRLLLTPMHRLGAANNLTDGFTALLESPLAPVALDNASATQECSICFCDANPEEDASSVLVAFEKCGHMCCSGCMTAFLSARIADTHSLSLSPVIRCFARGCGTAVSFRDFERFASQEASQLYQLRLTAAACRLIPDFSWCTKCESGGFIPNASSAGNCRDISCDACAHTYCLDCREDAHTGFTCAQKYEQIMSGDHFITERMSGRALLKLTKPCPSCTAPTIRDGGCSHMTCRACNFAWCWLCGNAYSGRYTFGNKCPCG